MVQVKGDLALLLLTIVVLAVVGAGQLQGRATVGEGVEVRSDWVEAVVPSLRLTSLNLNRKLY